MSIGYCLTVRRNSLNVEVMHWVFKCVTSSNVLRKGSLQTKLNAGLSEQQQEDLFQKMKVVSTK